MSINDPGLEQILNGCREHHRASQQRLFAEFYNYSMTIARRYMGSQENAEEVVSDAFFKTFTRIDSYSGKMPFRFWLRRIVINTAIDHLRSSANIPEATEWQEWHDVEMASGIDEDLTQEQILAMMDRLTPAYRTVFNLFVVDGLTHDEIAALLEISPGTSKSNLARARQQLKSLYFNDLEIPNRS